MSGDSITVEMRAEALLARLLGTSDRLMSTLRIVVNRLSIEVQSAVKEDKLTGQALHVRTGTLRRSINRVVNEGPSGVLATVGTNVKYAAVHEYGFNGDVTVRAHTRKIRAASDLAYRKLKSGGTAEQSDASFASMSGGTRAVTSPRPSVSNVREHTRHMRMPERSFLRSTLREKGPAIREQLRAAVLEAVRP
jgi:phage gpG-like protein